MIQMTKAAQNHENTQDSQQQEETRFYSIFPYPILCLVFAYTWF